MKVHEQQANGCQAKRKGSWISTSVTQAYRISTDESKHILGGGEGGEEGISDTTKEHSICKHEIMNYSYKAVHRHILYYQLWFHYVKFNGNKNF